MTDQIWTRTPHFLFSAICPHCSKRYGKPDPQGWIDVLTCPPCEKIGIKNQDNVHKTYQPKAKPEGWRDQRRKFAAPI